MENNQDTILENTLTHAVVNRDKKNIELAISKGATPTVSLFRWAFTEKYYDIALILAQHMVMHDEPKNFHALNDICLISTDYTRSHWCYKIAEQLILNNHDLADYFSKKTLGGKLEDYKNFKLLCNTIALNNKLSVLEEKTEHKQKIKI